MRDLTERISNCLLPRARRPGQYVGLEINARRADVEAALVTVALAFPDTYAIGISHLGSQVLYHMLNDVPAVACDRTYCPTLDGEAVMRSEGIPLFGWESRRAIADFDVIGFSLPYELCVTNVLTMLDLAGLALRAEDRLPDDPIVIAGDALAESPEPMADFIDVFLVGDGEVPLRALVDLVGEMKPRGASRQEIILAAARTIGGAYVPRYYESLGVADVAQAPVRPVRADVPEIIHRACFEDFADTPPVTAPLVPLSEGVQERVVIEIMRGCPNACRFCQAGATRLPVRFRSVDQIVEAAGTALDATGFREISLLSLSTSDYPHLDELIGRLTAEFAPRHVSISLPSLRVDSQLRQLPRLTNTVRKGGLTIAAEAGSERLRRAIGKHITEEDMLAGVRAAYEAGWRRVKVYFMAGLPGEGPDDIDAIYDLAVRLSEMRKDVDGQPGAISASVSWFVPKPHTPMQWCPMRDAEYFLAVRNRLKDLSRRSQVNFKFHRIERSVLEGVLARGDRRAGAVIEAAWRGGARMDAWNEHFSYDPWLAAFETVALDPAEIAHRALDPGDRLPWSHIRCRHSDDYLRKQYVRMMAELAQVEDGHGSEGA